MIPVQLVGKLTLNRLVDNFFAEEEQSSFDPATLVPGIAFTNDPVLQGRSFAYRDTDYHRLGTANINDIPINRPIVETNYNHREGYVRHRIDTDVVTYHKNSLADNTPSETPLPDGGFSDYPDQLDGAVTRDLPSSKFDDHFSQARLFWNSMSPPEKMDVIASFGYHLGKVVSKAIRQQTVDMFANVDEGMAATVADMVGVERPSGSQVATDDASPALSIAKTAYSARTQRVAVLIGNGFDDEEVRSSLQALEREGAFLHFVGGKLGTVAGANGMTVEIDATFVTAHPTLFDAYYIVGGTSEDQAMFDQNAMEYFRMGYKYFKPMGVATTGQAYVQLTDANEPAGVVLASASPSFGDDFATAVAQQRFWDRV